MLHAPKIAYVALRATSLAADVAQHGYFDPNVAPAQQLINALDSSIIYLVYYVRTTVPATDTYVPVIAKTKIQPGVRTYL